jgi:hypothetical protein
MMVMLLGVQMRFNKIRLRHFLGFDFQSTLKGKGLRIYLFIEIEVVSYDTCAHKLRKVARE